MDSHPETIIAVHRVELHARLAEGERRRLLRDEPAAPSEGRPGRWRSLAWAVVSLLARTPDPPLVWMSGRRPWHGFDPTGCSSRRSN